MPHQTSLLPIAKACVSSQVAETFKHFMPSRGKTCMQWVAIVTMAWGLAIGNAQAQGMTTPGQFAVSESGAATYTIPIQVPPGVAGMQPQLALGYNSQSGNGLLGVGWNLSGLSAITRCPRTMAQDGVRGGVNYNNDDRFCLDGQRLMMVSGSYYGAPGSEYRTERESFSRITYDGTAFRVQGKAGVVSEYGVTGDSRIEAQGKSVVRVWTLNKMIDVAGNYLKVSYHKENGDYRINQIDYAGNDNTGQAAQNTIRFSYEGRPDVISVYAVGSGIQMTQRLSKISVIVAGNITRNFNFLYAQTNSNIPRSTLTSFQDCDVLGVCMPMSVHTYADSNTLNWLPNQSQANLQPMGTSGAWFIDINGDGVVDYVTKNNDGVIYLNLGTGSGNSANQWGASQSQSGLNYSGVAGVWFVDINGDGLPDFVTKNNDGNILWNMGVGTGQSNTQWGPSQSQNSLHGVGNAGAWFVDINGDGLADYVTKNNDGTIHWNMALGTGVSGSQWGPSQSQSGLNGVANAGIWFIDINGDGLIDYVTKSSDGVIYWNLGTGTGVAGSQWGASQSQSGLLLSDNATTWFVDINGDGLLDCVGRDVSGMISWNIATGSGISASQWLPTQAQMGAVQTYTEKRSLGFVSAYYYVTVSRPPLMTWFTDVNGDGFADCVLRYTDGIYVQLGRGTGIFPTQWAEAVFQTDVQGVGTSGKWLVDINGDGFPDYITKNNDSVIMWNLQSNKSYKINNIQKLSNFMSFDIQYDLLNKYPVIQDFSSMNSYPVRKISIPIPVVTTVKNANGIGTSNTTTYSYGGLKTEIGTGRGMLGFQWMKSKEELTGIESYTEYRQDWPYTGLPIVNETRLAGAGANGVLKRTQMSYACKTGLGADCQPVPANCNLASNIDICKGIANARVFPYAASVTEQSWDFNGTAMPTTVTNTRFDKSGSDPLYWGDTSLVEVTTSDGTSSTKKLVQNEYYPAVTTNGKWIAGRLKKASVTSTLTAP